MKPLTKKYTIARLRNHFEVLLGHRRAGHGEFRATSKRSVAEQYLQEKTTKDEKVAHGSAVIVRGSEGRGTKSASANVSAVLQASERVRAASTGKPIEENASVRKTDNRRGRFLSAGGGLGCWETHSKTGSRQRGQS